MDNIDIKRRLDLLCEKGQKHLRLWSLARIWNVVVNQGVTAGLILSCIIIVLSLGSLLLGRDIWALGPWETAVFLLALTGSYIIVRSLWAFLFFKADRVVSLTFFDEYLSSGSRMATADEFISRKPSTPFEQAAVEDVIHILEQGERAELPKVMTRLAPLSAVLHAKIAGLFGLVILASWLQTAPFDALLQKNLPAVMAAERGRDLLTGPDQEISARMVSREDEILAELNKKDDQSDQTSAKETENRQAGDEGKSSSTKAGKTQTTGQSSGSQGGAGSLTPSPDTNPQKAGDKKPQKSGKKSNGKNLKKAAQKENAQRKSPPKPKAPTAGQKSQQTEKKTADKKKTDKGNRGPETSNKKNSPALMAKKSSDPTGAGEQNRQKKSEDRQVRASSEMKQKKSSGAQLRAKAEPEKKKAPRKSGKGKKSGKKDQKKPSNREKGKAQKPSNKKPSGKPSSRNQKNSATGKQKGKGVDPIKKSRGVASLMLGVPLPDRIKGQAREGYIKKTQEKSDPKAEKSAMQNAGARTERSGKIAPISHPVMTPAMQRVVQKYFETIGQYSKETEKE
ncbi:MAG: hypothetical protein L3J58_01915 [Emcibacter sp.]|nr:hypothetical protein [Emcibacter sp.]